jgi:hypothetical protein
MSKEQEVTRKFSVTDDEVGTIKRHGILSMSDFPKTALHNQEPTESPSEAKEKITPIIEPETGAKKGEVAGQQSTSEFTKGLRKLLDGQLTTLKLKRLYTQSREACDRLDKSEAENKELKHNLQYCGARFEEVQDDKKIMAEQIKELEAQDDEYMRMKE